MTFSEKPDAERRIEQRIGNLLRAGVLLAGAVVLVGGIAHTIAHGHEVPDYGVFRGEPSSLKSVTMIVRDAFSLRSADIIQLGLLILIATPVARVALAAVAFAHARDRLYAVVSLVVLATLIASLVGYI